MKRNILIIVVLLLGILLVVYFFWNKEGNNQELSIYNHIPKTNGIVGAINYSAIEDIIQTEIFQNPMDLLAIKDSLGNQKFIGDLMLTLIQGGIDKEQKIIFSIAKNVDKESFLLMHINDFHTIKEAIKDNLSPYPHKKMEFQKETVGNYYGNEKVGVILNNQFLMVAFAGGKKTIALWKRIVKKEGCYKENNTSIRALTDNPNHISVWAAKNSIKSPFINGNNTIFLHVNFLKGKLEFVSTISSNTTYFTNEALNSYNCDTCALEFHLNMSKINSIPTMLSSKINFKIDSISQLFNIKYPQILDLCNGKIDCAIMGKGIQKDKIVAYEFDDDFNKIKKEQIISTPIINFILSIGSDGKALYNHLKKKEIIKQKNSSELFTNPIAKCYTQANNRYLLLMSNKTSLLKSTKADTLNHGFILKTSFERLIPLFPQKENYYFTLIKSVECKGGQQDSLINFKIDITTKNSSKNSLFSLVEACFY